MACKHSFPSKACFKTQFPLNSEINVIYKRSSFLNSVSVGFTDPVSLKLCVKCGVQTQFPLNGESNLIQMCTESSLIKIFTGCIWKAKDAKYYHVDNKDFDQTVQIRRLI